MSTQNVDGRPTLIACGAVDRGDDAAAAEALKLVPPAALADARVRVVDQLTIEELLDAAAVGPVVIADAAVGVSPGAVAEFPFAALVSVARSLRARSSHELPVGDLVALAETLLGRPVEGTVVVVGASRVAYGVGLSSVVRCALPAFASAIVRAVKGGRPTIARSWPARAERTAIA